MNKHDLILAIQAKQEAKQLTVQSYDVLNRYKESVLQETFTNLTNGFGLEIDQVKTILTSLQQSNGCTYHPVTGEINPVTGFMVALIGYELVVNNIWNTLDLKHILNFWLASIGFNPNDNPRFFIGLWISNDKLYIDLSENVPNRELAIQLGKDRYQLSIWDCANKVQIETPQTSTAKIDADILTDKRY